MNSTIKLYIHKSMRLFLHLFWFLPIKNNRILYSAFDGRSFACSPKYLYQYLKDTDDSFEHIWAFSEPEKFANLGLKTVKYHSLKWVYYVLTSNVIITNSNTFAFIPKRKSQLMVNTWHGGGAYKKVGFARGKQLPAIEEWTYKMTSRDVRLFVSSSETFTETNLHEGFHYSGRVINSGLPRNDLLLDEVQRENTAKIVKERLGIANCYCILYAPTYRGDLNNAEESQYRIPYDLILKKAKELHGPNSVLLIRDHYYTKANGNAMKNDHILDVSSYPDMQELLCASDLLITDYSSAMWDFGLMRRPCLLYVPDIDKYENERGLFTPIDIWSGIKCTTVQELIDGLNIDISTVEEKAIQQEKQFGSYEKGNATEQVGKRVISFIHGREKETL